MLPRSAEGALVWTGATLGAALPATVLAAAWAAAAACACGLALVVVLAVALLAFGAGWLLPSVPVGLALLLARCPLLPCEPAHP